jgi:type IV secretion system protein VirB5
MRFAELFKRPAAPAADHDANPYLAARRAWNDHVARLIAARTMWQVVGLLSLMIAVASVGGLIHLAGRSRFVPYVVEVDTAGNVRAVQRAQEMPPAGRAVIEAQLERFVTLSRRVTTDIGLQRAAIFGVYAMMTEDDAAAGKMTEYLNGDEERTPFRRAEKETVNTELTSVLQQTEDTWQVDWTETVYERGSGKRKDRFGMRALVQVYQTSPQHMSEEALRTNPLGIYVRDFSWNRKQAREVPQ